MTRTNLHAHDKDIGTINYKILFLTFVMAVFSCDYFSLSRLTEAEARLSQSEDENKKLCEDLKDMLATHTEIQMQLMLDQKEIEDMVN